MAGTTNKKRKLNQGKETIVLNDDDSSVFGPELFAEPEPVSRNDIKIIQKRQPKKKKVVEDEVNPYKYYTSVADLESHMHEDVFKQFAEYKTWQDFYANKNRSYKLTISAKETSALTNALNADWQKECTEPDPCRRFSGYIPGVSYPLKDIFDFTNNAKLKENLTKLLSFKKSLQLKIQKYQMGNPLYWPRFQLPSPRTPIPSPTSSPSRSPERSDPNPDPEPAVTSKPKSVQIIKVAREADQDITYCNWPLIKEHAVRLSIESKKLTRAVPKAGGPVAEQFLSP